jgi:hypothetical protein
MSVADEILYSPDESATGVAATTAAPEARDGETAIIADADAVTHLDQLAWSDEPDTDDFTEHPVEPRQSSWLHTAVIGVGILVAGLVVADGVGLLRHADHASTTTATTTADPWTTEAEALLATPAQNAPLAAPPTTTEVTAPPVTITHAKPAFAPTPAEDQAVLNNITGMGYRIAADRTWVISEAQESCRLTRQGERARQVDETLMAAYGSDLDNADGSAVSPTVSSTIVSSAAVQAYANCY